MKIQCPCGAKYAFDITPEMVVQPISFVCQQCGVDSSAVVNQIIRESFGAQPAKVAGPAAAAAPVRVHVPRPQTASSPVAVPVATSLRVSSGGPVAAAPAASHGTDGPQPCHKHVGQFAVERCVVCQKPICPKCMEMFGYVCSAFCKGKAESQRIYVPVYAGQKAVAEARYWRKSGLIFGSIILTILLIVGGLSYYKWVASVPHVTFSVKLPDKAHFGSCRIIGRDQVVFLHGGLLARHDMKKKKEVWSRQLLDREKIMRDAEKELNDEQENRKHGRDSKYRVLPSLAELQEESLRDAEAGLSLYVDAGYVWVALPDKLVKYDWETGQPAKEIALGDGYYDKTRKGDKLILVTHDEDGEKVTKRISLQSGEIQSDEKPKVALAQATGKGTTAATKGRVPASARPGSSVVKASLSSADADKRPINPEAMAAAVQNMPVASRMALPAALATKANQQRLMAQMREDDEEDGAPRRRAPGQKGPDYVTTHIKDGSEQVQFSVALLEKKEVARQAMKAPPTKSVLDGDIRVTQTMELVNEFANEMQRERTDGIEIEDVSRYGVRLRRGSSEWTNEMIGPPSLFPLKTRDVVSASKRIVVLDKQAKKLWESALTFDVPGGSRDDSDDSDDSDEPLSKYGAGPLVERGDVLYVCDQGVLTAFDATTGNARWRLPSVGILGLIFDDEGGMYVNTTTASHEKIKYSQQIDVSDRTHDQVLKVDPATGKILWTAVNEGLINYFSGKFLYSISSYEGDEPDETLAGIPGATIAPHIRIKRLNPKNGKVMWEHYQRRAPLDIQIDKNTIQILFRKEMQVLKYISL
jgi:hypothetical protein